MEGEVINDISDFNNQFLSIVELFVGFCNGCVKKLNLIWSVNFYAATSYSPSKALTSVDISSFLFTIFSSSVRFTLHGSTNFYPGRRVNYRPPGRPDYSLMMLWYSASVTLSQSFEPVSNLDEQKRDGFEFGSLRGISLKTGRSICLDHHKIIQASLGLCRRADFSWICVLSTS